MYSLKCQIINYDKKIFYKVVFEAVNIIPSLIIHLRLTGNCSSLQNINDKKFRMLWIPFSNILNILKFEDTNFKCQIIVYDENMLDKIVLCINIFLSYIIHLRPNGNCSNLQNMNNGKFRILWISHSNILNNLKFSLKLLT
jgi:hypothetical protein